MSKLTDIQASKPRTIQAIKADKHLTECSLLSKIDEMDWLIRRRKELKNELLEAIKNG